MLLCKVKQFLWLQLSNLSLNNTKKKSKENEISFKETNEEFSAQEFNSGLKESAVNIFNQFEVIVKTK